MVLILNTLPVCTATIAAKAICKYCGKVLGVIQILVPSLIFLIMGVYFNSSHEVFAAGA
jgi:hypothetical protein